MKVKFIQIFLLAALLSVYNYAQTLPEWVAVYNNSGKYDVAYSLIIDSKNNNIVIGTTGTTFNSNNKDILMVKYDENGNEIFHSIYGATDNRGYFVSSAIIDSKDNIYLTGQVIAPGMFVYDIFNLLMKYDSSGVLRWIKVDTTSRSAEPKKIILDSNEQILQIVRRYNHMRVTKYDSSGNQIWNWNQIDSSTYVSSPTDVVIDMYNNIYIAGYADHSGSGGYSILTKLNADGVLLWQKTFYRTNCYSQSMVIDSANNICVTGEFYNGNNDYDAFLLKYNNEGLLKWYIYYNSALNLEDAGSLLCADESNNIYLYGTIYDRNGGFLTDYYLNKYDSSGVLLWNRVYEANVPNYVSALNDCLLMDFNGSVYFSVSDKSYSLNDFKVLKI